MSIFALGATPSQIQKAFDDNAGYQRPQFPVEKDIVSSMSDPAAFQKYLGNEKYFRDYEIFFQKEIERHDGNWGAVLNEHLFADTDKARDLLVRMFAGFYHPIIHLGFGIEFEQPVIIIEALAQAATHDCWPKQFIEKTTELVEARKGSNIAPLTELLEKAAKNQKIRESVRYEDGNKVRDGVFKRALPEIVDLCSQWRVEPTKEDLKFRTAEMINMCAYFAGAAQHSSRRKQVKFDFFYMHSINCSIFFSAFLNSKLDSWLKFEDRVRLLQFKAWSDLAMYVSRGTPDLLLDEIVEYKPKRPNDDWNDLFQRVNVLPDDGHAPKLLRALANAEKVCADYEGKEEAKNWKLKDNMFLSLGHMAADSVEGTSNKWARNVGWDSAWDDIPERSEPPNKIDGRQSTIEANPNSKSVAETYDGSKL